MNLNLSYIVFIIAMPFLLISCRKDQEKFEFIAQVLNNPHNIEGIISKSKIKSEPFMQLYADSTEKAKHIQKLATVINKHILPNHSVVCNRERQSFNSEKGQIEIIHEIAIVGDDENNTLIFTWIKLYGRWKLQDIFISAKVWCN